MESEYESLWYRMIDLVAWPEVNDDESTESKENTRDKDSILPYRKETDPLPQPAIEQQAIDLTNYVPPPTVPTATATAPTPPTHLTTTSVLNPLHHPTAVSYQQTPSTLLPYATTTPRHLHPYAPTTPATPAIAPLVHAPPLQMYLPAPMAMGNRLLQI